MKLGLSGLKSGTIMVMVENDDDLWVLSQVIYEGDLVRAPTFRKIKIGDAATDRSVKVVRKRMMLKLKMEKAEFAGSLVKILGTIMEGPDDVSVGEHHSFSIEPGTKVNITKAYWPSYLIDKLKQAEKSNSAKVLICVFDREEATFAVGSDIGCKILSSVKGNMPKKIDVKHVASDFFKEISKQLVEYVKRYDAKTILIASPAFWKEYLVAKMKDEPKLDGIKIVTGVVNAGGERGINEVLKRSEIKQALSNVRVSEEMVLVEDMLKAISKDGAVAYGVKDCKSAAEAGAVEKLLVSEAYIDKQRQVGDVKIVENIMQIAEQSSGKVHLIGTHDGGKKLEGLGGVAAILRYKI
jgi:protein pelota